MRKKNARHWRKFVRKWSRYYRDHPPPPEWSGRTRQACVNDVHPEAKRRR